MDRARFQSTVNREPFRVVIRLPVEKHVAGVV